MSGRCEDCVHWRRSEDDEDSGICRLISESARVGVGGRREPYEFASKMAVILVDGERYVDSELVTSFDFGCVQFERA